MVKLKTLYDVRLYGKGLLCSLRIVRIAHDSKHEMYIRTVDQSFGK